MAEKVCCPGPIGGNNGNSAGGFREAVCVHTKKVYDSCRSKECLRDIRVYLTRDAQELINAGGIASVKPREAELLCVSIDVERIQFNRGFYSVDIRFFYRIECEISCVIGRPRIVDGLAVFDKRVVLFGGEGGARIFSSQYIEDGRDVQLRPDSNKPTAVVEVVDPIMLDARVVAPEASCNCCCQNIKCYRFTKRQKAPSTEALSHCHIRIPILCTCPLSCLSPPELLPPDFPEPPDLFLLLLAAEDSCV
ncbi:MAG: hypothetical protein ACLSF2_06300 [Butyricicoccus sp.]